MAATATKLEPGMVVFVYHDPETKTHCEGSATLVRRVEEDRVQDIEHYLGMEFWEVEFVDDPGVKVLRWVTV